MPVKSVLAVHDLSGVGRCALTVVLPALAASGLQPIPLPTAVLSSHTGGFTHMARRTLTDFMGECVRHWNELGLRFDAIYTGYLADPAQGELLLALIDSQRETGNPYVLVDPAMGDDGALYQGIDPAMPRVMRELCRRADLATPNLTEAMLLCGRDPLSPLPDEEAARELLPRIGAKKCVITGARIGGQYENLFSGGSVAYRACAASYPGTGDLFASVLLGRILKGHDLHKAVDFASRFLSDVVFDTAAAGCEPRMGLGFEPFLARLAQE